MEEEDLPHELSMLMSPGYPMCILKQDARVNFYCGLKPGLIFKELLYSER
jgi:hypothetical protein